MKRLIYFIVLVSVIALHGATSVLAAEPKQGMAITPPTFELSANPGNSLQNSIRVDNLTDQPLKLTIERKNFTALGEEGQVGLTAEESTFSLASWIKVDPTEAEVPAKGSKTFTFTVNVPLNAEPGGRFGSIVFKTIPQPFTGQTGLSIAQEVGALVLMRVAGDVKESANIDQFKAVTSFFEYGPVKFETRVKNTGNTHIKPQGTITITNFVGHKVATIPVDSKNVLPDAIRRIESTWNNKNPFGKYTATLSLQYGSDQQILTSSTTFLVIPYRMVLAWLIVILIIGVLLYLGRQRIHRAIKILAGKE